VRDKEGLGFGDVFGAKAEIRRVVSLPLEGDRVELTDQRKAGGERQQVFLVAKTRRAGRDLIESVSA